MSRASDSPEFRMLKAKQDILDKMRAESGDVSSLEIRLMQSHNDIIALLKAIDRVVRVDGIDLEAVNALRAKGREVGFRLLKEHEKKGVPG